MGKLWMHARANIKKTKSVSAALVFMFVIAAFLLNTGLLIIVNYSGFFDSLKKELSPADVYFMLPDDLYTGEVQSLLAENEHIRQMQENSMLLVDAKILYQGKSRSFNILFCDMDEKRDISKWKFVGRHLPAEEMSVYIPDIFKAVGGYRLNDTIKLTVTDQETKAEKTLSFTVKGYIEDIFFSAADTGFMGFYLPADTYQTVANMLDDPGHSVQVTFANFDHMDHAKKAESEIRELLQLDSPSLLVSDSSSLFVVLDLELIEMARCMMASMVSVMMVVFSFVIAGVCLLVVRFRIVNSIEEDALKIGSLKAAGYTGRQIMLSVILQFSLIAGAGSAVGIFLSYPALPAVSAIFEKQSGLKWEQGPDMAVSASALFILLFVVSVVAWAAARRIGALCPISALRGETSARKYKRNRLPLEKAVGRLPVWLAIKSVAQSAKQSVMIGIILAATTFAGAYGVIMFYNTTVDTKAFAEVPGMEVCNAVAVLHPEKDQAASVETISQMPAVRKVLFLDEVKIKVDGEEASAYVMESYAQKESQMVYEGRYPENQGEIALAGILAESLHKTVGENVTVCFGSREDVFKIVGLSNGASMGGRNTSMLLSDFTRLNPVFKRQTLYIYLDKGTNAAAFIVELENKLNKDRLLGIVNFDEKMAEGMASYQSVVTAMGLTMLFITLLVTALVLYFVISSTVIRKKRELGIQKAIGFTTVQLMHQLSISFGVPVLLGTAAGSFLSARYTNPLMSVVMKGMGVMRARFIIPSLWVFSFGLFVVVFAYLLSLLTTWRIRKISAYALVTE